MFYKKKKIEPEIDSIIWYQNHRHYVDQTWLSTNTFYKRLNDWKIKKLFYPIYKWDEMVWRRKLYVDFN